MAEDKIDKGVDLEPPPVPNAPPPIEERRKSLGFTTSWSSQPPARKYSLNDAPCEYKGLKETSNTTEGGGKSPTEEKVDENKPELSPKTRQEIVFAHKDPKPVQKHIEKTKKVNETPASGSSMPPTPNTAMKMSCMEEEAIRERLRTLLLRQTAEILDAEGVGTKFTKESFRRTFLNKVSFLIFSDINLKFVKTLDIFYYLSKCVLRKTGKDYLY